MELSAARRLMVVSRMYHFHQKHVVSIAKLTNPRVCSHAGSFLRYRDACKLFAASKLKQLYLEKKSRRTSGDAVILRTELESCRTFYRTLLMKRRNEETTHVQPQNRPRRNIEGERIHRRRVSAKERRQTFMEKVAEHLQRFHIRRTKKEIMKEN